MKLSLIAALFPLSLFACGGAPPPSPPVDPTPLAMQVDDADAGATISDPPPAPDADPSTISTDAGTTPMVDSGDAVAPTPRSDAGSPAPDAAPPSTGSLYTVNLPPDMEAGIDNACTLYDSTAPSLCEDIDNHTYYCTNLGTADNCGACRSPCGGTMGGPIPTTPHGLTVCNTADLTPIYRQSHPTQSDYCIFRCDPGFTLCNDACVEGSVCP